MGSHHHCRSGPRRFGCATEGAPGPVGIAVARAANDPPPGRRTVESLEPVARLRRSAAGQPASGAASHAPLLSCLGHGPHAVPCPHQPVHAAARPGPAADGHLLLAVGRADRAGGGLVRLGQRQDRPMGDGQCRDQFLPLRCHRRAGLCPGTSAVRRLLPGPAADDAGSGPGSQFHAGDGQRRLPTAVGGHRLPPAGRDRPGQREALCGDGSGPCAAGA